MQAITRQCLAWGTATAQPKATIVVGPFQHPSTRQPTATATARAHLARSSGMIRDYSSEEPDAGKLQVRICGGGGGRLPPLPDHLIPPGWAGADPKRSPLAAANFRRVCPRRPLCYSMTSSAGKHSCGDGEAKRPRCPEID